MKKTLFKKSMAWLLALMMVITFMPTMAFGEEGDDNTNSYVIPQHSKTVVDNKDGTYTIALDVTGDSTTSTKVTKTNVIIVMDVSGSMDTGTGNSEVHYREATAQGRGTRYGLIGEEYVELYRWGNTFYYQAEGGWKVYEGQLYRRYVDNETRLEAAKRSVGVLAKALLDHNGGDNPDDAFELALVSFATTASIVQGPTNDYDAFYQKMDDLDANGGTNWEDALTVAKGVDFGDDDQVFVIFVSDGNPTFHKTDGGYNNYNGYYGVYGTGYEQNTNISNCYNQAVKAVKDLVGEGDNRNVEQLYTIGAYGNVTLMQNLTTAAGMPEENYYDATDTEGLETALNDILEKIETAGISQVEIDDGTTSEVTTDSGQFVASLLTVDETSYKYYRSGGNYGTEGYGDVWADAPEATLENGHVIWDLKSAKVLENGVKYTVTFDVYPSQTTLDYIADIKNDPGEDGAWSKKLPAEVREYIDVDGKLKTNTGASISYIDTREENPTEHTESFIPPESVSSTAVEQLAVTKDWSNLLEADDEWEKPEEISLWVTRDGKETYKVTLNDGNKWTNTVFISIGIIKDGEALEGSEGHDFTFVEPKNLSYHWEIDVPIVHPMKIGEDVVILIKKDAKHTNPDNAKEYTINGKTYYVGTADDVALTATNERRSSLDLKKVVDGDDAPDKAEFPFTAKVVNSLAPATQPEDDPDHKSDYWVWISVRDFNVDPAEYPNGKKVYDAVKSGATAEIGTDGQPTGYYYAKSGAEIVINMKDNYSVRFNNLPTGSTYEITEGQLPEDFAYDKADIKITKGKGSTEASAPGRTSTGKIENANAIYTLTYTNKYGRVDVNVDKVWDDENNKDKLRPETLELTLEGVPSGVTVPKAKITKSADGNTWTYVWEGLPRFDSEGAEIEYTVTEGTVPKGYTPSGSPAKDGGTITNKHTVIPDTPPGPTPTPIPDEPVPLDLNGEDHFAYIEGYPDGTVQPEGNITRAEVATMIYRLLTYDRRDEIFTSECNYSDVAAKNWFNKAVASMTAGEYVEGYPDGSFLPNQKITRAEFVTIVVRFLEGERDAENPFTDIDGHWAQKYILSAVDAGWIDGYPDGTFRPQEPIKRDEAMKIMNTILHRGVNEESELGEPVMFPDNADASKWYYYEVIEATNNHDTEGERPDEDWLSNECEYEYDIVKYERPDGAAPAPQDDPATPDDPAAPEDQDEPAATDNSIVGQWEYTEEGVDGAFVYTFNEDGTGNYDMAGTVKAFTYTIEGNTLSILYEGDTEPFVLPFVVTDTTLTVKDSNDEDVVYNKK